MPILLLQASRSGVHHQRKMTISLKKLSHQTTKKFPWQQRESCTRDGVKREDDGKRLDTKDAGVTHEEEGRCVVSRWWIPSLQMS
jgi:hypothetical protein